jgi:hypothetical protein
MMECAECGGRGKVLDAPNRVLDGGTYWEPCETCNGTGEMPYVWKIGDVFTNGEYRWRVESVHGERAVLRSCTTAWACTILLTYAEWMAGNKWRLETEAADGI